MRRCLLRAIQSIFAILLANVGVTLRVYAQVPGEVRGRVVDARTLQPIAEAQITLSGRPEVVRSSADGEFILRGVDPREHVIVTRALGYSPRDVQVRVVNGRSTRIEIALDASLVTLGRVLVKAGRDTQSVQAMTFDRAAIENSHRRDIGELLQSAPGVVITQAGGPGASTRISIRGSSSGEVLVLLDGVPLNSSISGSADLSRISLESVERVTILTGAQSARYGPRALAGVIDIETRRTAEDASALVRAGSWKEREGSVTLGNIARLDGRRLNGSVTGAYRSVRGDFPFRLPALRGNALATRVNSDVRSGDILASLRLEDESGASGIRASWRDLRRGLAGSIIQPSMTGRETTSRLSGGLDARRQIGAFAISALADLSRERATFIDPAPPFGVPYNDSVTATGLTASTTISAGGAVSSALAGAEIRTLDVRSTMLAAGAPHSQRLLGVFSTYKLSRPLPSIGAVLSADAAARVDGSSLDGSTALSPRIGANLSRGVAVASVSVGNGYSPPTLADQFFQEGVLVRANPALRPERTKGDVEGRLTLRDNRAGPLRMSATAAAFRADVDGMILWLPDFRFIWSPSNFQVHRSGYELSGKLSTLAQKAEVQGTLNRTNVTYTGPVLSGQVAYRPRTTGSVTLTLAPRNSRIALTTRYVGERRTVPGSALNTLDPYSITDASVSSPFARRRVAFDLALGVENLFDRPAAMLVDYPFPGRVWSISFRARHLTSN